MCDSCEDRQERGLSLEGGKCFRVYSSRGVRCPTCAHYKIKCSFNKEYQSKGKGKGKSKAKSPTPDRGGFAELREEIKEEIQKVRGEILAEMDRHYSVLEAGIQENNALLQRLIECLKGNEEESEGRGESEDKGQGEEDVEMDEGDNDDEIEYEDIDRPLKRLRRYKE
jgi:hypothetical protein